MLFVDMASVEEEVVEKMERVDLSEEYHDLRELVCKCEGESTCWDCKFILDTKFKVKIKNLPRSDLKVYSFQLVGDEDEPPFTAATCTWEGAKELFVKWLSLDRGDNTRIKRGSVVWERLETPNGAFDCYLFRYKFGPGKNEQTFCSFLENIEQAKDDFYAYFHKNHFDSDDKSYVENLREKKDTVKRLTIKWS